MPPPAAPLVRHARAGWGYRFAAFLIDAMLALAIGVMVAVLIESRGGDGATAQAVGLLASIPAWVALTSGVSAVTKGQSVGKLFAGTRAVRDGGRPVGFWSSFLRDTICRLPYLIPPFAIADILWPLRRRRESFRDRATSTHVLKTNAYPRRKQAVIMAAFFSVFALYLAILDEDDLVTYSRDEWVADCNPDDGQAAYCDCVYDSLDDDLDEEHINELAGGVDSENISRQTKQALKGAMDECGHLGRDS